MMDQGEKFTTIEGRQTWVLLSSQGDLYRFKRSFDDLTVSLTQEEMCSIFVEAKPTRVCDELEGDCA